MSTTDGAGGKEPGLTGLRPRIAYVSYHVSSLERALGFYVGALGMIEQLRLDLGGGLHEVVLVFPDSPACGLILMWDEARTAPYRLGDGYSRFIVRVTDVDAAIERLAGHGADVMREPTDAGSLRYSMLRDPDGYVVELLQFKR